MRLGLDFGNSDDGVRHGAVGEGSSRRLSLMPFLPRGSRGQRPQGNELPRKDHGLNMGKGRGAGPSPSSNHSGLWYCFSGRSKLRIFALP